MTRCWSDYASGDRPAVADILDYIKAEAIRTVQKEKMGTLPKEEENSGVLDLTGRLQRDSEFPSAGGGFADIWKATWKRDSTACKVSSTHQIYLHPSVTVPRWLSRYCGTILVMSMPETNSTRSNLLKSSPAYQLTDITIAIASRNSSLAEAGQPSKHFTTLWNGSRFWFLYFFGLPVGG